MKLRYYLRGLGIGMIVTALILGIAGGGKEQLSDAEIKQRAAALGMVDSGSLTLSSLPQTSANDSKESLEQGTADHKALEETKEVTGTVALEETKPLESTDATRSEEAVASTGESDSSMETQIKEIVIESGVHSYEVSVKLQEAGLVADAEAFDQYLCDQGYSKSIHAGTYRIEMGISEADIAKIICRKR
ncbi:MAG: hypothetical protein IJF07_04630 [Lachnospiraceae bacterium]|nr:hypothetical protein [Lachnospiraceae bacterium]